MTECIRNIDILRRIVRYCDEAGEATRRFGRSKDCLRSDAQYRNAVAFCTVQVARLASHLSPDFTTAYSWVPWRSVRGLGGCIHWHGDLELEALWATVNEDIPALREYMAGIVREYDLLQQAADYSGGPGSKLEEVSH